MAQGSDTQTIANNPAFNLRCKMIAAQYAVNTVFVETPLTNHAARVSLGQKILTGAIAPEVLAFIVLGDPNIQAAALADAPNAGAVVADIDIQSRLQNVWDALSAAGF